MIERERIQGKEPAAETVGSLPPVPVAMRNDPDISATGGRASRLGKYLLAGSVALMTVVVYLPSLRNEFVIWDDDLYILNNHYIRSLGWDLLRWSFSTFYAGNWHPLTWLSHAFDYALWGLDPAGHHLTNILIHGINTALVVLLCLQLFGTMREQKGASASTGILDGPGRMIAAVSAGLLFGVHPLHVESVAWVSERKDLLCGLFFLLSVMAYVEHSSKRGASIAAKHAHFIDYLRNYSWRSFLFFALALMAKPMAVSLPIVLLLLDWCMLGRTVSRVAFTRAALEKTPYAVLSLLSSWVTLEAQQGAMWTVAIPLQFRLLTAAKALALYLYKMLIPMHLLPLYQYVRDPAFYRSVAYAGAVTFVIAVTAVCIKGVLKGRTWPAVWFYYGVTLFPVLGLVQVGQQSMADRYTYLPSIGPFMLVGMAAAWTWARAGKLHAGRGAMRALLVCCAIGLILALSWSTVRQIAVWKDTETLWTSVIEKEPLPVPAAHFNRGLARGRSGNYAEALEDFNKAVEYDPLSGQAYMNRGVALGQLGRYEEAVEDLTIAIQLNPDNVQAYLNRAVGYESLGREQDALTDYGAAIRLAPDLVRAYLDRGSLYTRTGQIELAVKDYQVACDEGSTEGCSSLQEARKQRSGQQ